MLDSGLCFLEALSNWTCLGFLTAALMIYFNALDAYIPQLLKIQFTIKLSLK